MTTAEAEPATPRPVGRYEWEAVLRRLELPKEVKYVGFVMATYADPNGTRIRPGAAELAAAVGEGESTLRRRVSFLRKHGLILQTARGGGRNGSGRPTEYRLTLPLDLLEQFEIRPVGTARIAAVPPLSPLTQESAQNEDSPLTQVERSNEPSPVDNPVDEPVSPLALVSAQTEQPTNFDRSNNGVSETLTAQNSTLTAHPWVSNYRPQDLPPRPTTTPDPAQPQHARDNRLTSNDPAAIELGPRRCPHGLRNATRHDGTPRCPACRRGLPAGGEPP